MSNQVKANQVRIELLEKQNMKMERTIKKLNGSNAAAQQPQGDTTPHYDSVSDIYCYHACIFFEHVQR